jgi:hypothetical protein
VRGIMDMVGTQRPGPTRTIVRQRTTGSVAVGCQTAAVWSGMISQSEEGDSPRPRRGSIPARELMVRGDDGQLLEVRNGPADGDTPAVQLTLVREIGRHRFDRCPICLTPDPGSEEHVPSAALGGRVLTSTCAPCNNGLGRVEAELIDWRDDALRHTRATADAVRGARKLPRLLRRSTPDGQFVLIVDGSMHPDAEPMLKGHEFSLLLTPPDPNRYKLAALKHAYLAACLELRSIPETPSADVIRRDLRGARDATSRAGVPVSQYARSMPLMRTHGQPTETSVALAVVRRPDGMAEIWIALAGTIAVPWPLPDCPPVI